MQFRSKVASQNSELLTQTTLEIYYFATTSEIKRTVSPEVGTVDRGETIEQAIASVKEATQLYLEEFSRSFPYQNALKHCP
jgi:predicted RNase H-like HicB family nuclease